MAENTRQRNTLQLQGTSSIELEIFKNIAGVSRILLQLWHEETAFQDESSSREISWSSDAEQTLVATGLKAIVLEVSKDSRDKDAP